MELSNAEWRKSRRSGSNGGDCVEIARTDDDVIVVRDSKDPYGPVLAFSPTAFRRFAGRLKH